MVKVNPHYAKIDRPYIFGLIEEKLKDAPPGVINLGVGDICRPLDPLVVAALKEAADEMGKHPRGYGPPQGYAFLRNAIVDTEYNRYGIEPDEIFVSDGTKGDAAYLQELLCQSARVGIADPTYPTYVDVNILQGRSAITYLPCSEKNDFIPTPPDFPLDLIYLCSPNNPTGAAMDYHDLEAWVAYAKKHNALILFDAAYVDFARPHMPRSIYEIPGAKEVAIEMRTFSKSAGFTGLRCAYAVVPKATGLHAAWLIRQNTKSNGVAYPVQRAALAALSIDKKDVAHYAASARTLIAGLHRLGQIAYGGLDAPYIFWKAPEGLSSWQFFDELLAKARCLTIPGSSFGPCGEGYVRLSSFLKEGAAEEALSRIEAFFSPKTASLV